MHVSSQAPWSPAASTTQSQETTSPPCCPPNENSVAFQQSLSRSSRVEASEAVRVQCEGPVPRPTGFSYLNPDAQPQIGSPTLSMTPLPTPSQPAPDAHRTYRIFWTTSPGLSLYPSLVTSSSGNVAPC